MPPIVNPGSSGAAAQVAEIQNDAPNASNPSFVANQLTGTRNHTNTLPGDTGGFTTESAAEQNRQADNLMEIMNKVALKRKNFEMPAPREMRTLSQLINYFKQKGKNFQELFPEYPIWIRDQATLARCGREVYEREKAGHEKSAQVTLPDLTQEELDGLRGWIASHALLYNFEPVLKFRRTGKGEGHLEYYLFNIPRNHEAASVTAKVKALADCCSSLNELSHDKILELFQASGLSYLQVNRRPILDSEFPAALEGTPIQGAMQRVKTALISQDTARMQTTLDELQWAVKGLNAVKELIRAYERIEANPNSPEPIPRAPGLPTLKDVEPFRYHPSVKVFRDKITAVIEQRTHAVCDKFAGVRASDLTAQADVLVPPMAPALRSAIEAEIAQYSMFHDMHYLVVPRLIGQEKVSMAVYIAHTPKHTDSGKQSQRWEKACKVYRESEDPSPKTLARLLKDYGFAYRYFNQDKINFQTPPVGSTDLPLEPFTHLPKRPVKKNGAPRGKVADTPVAAPCAVGTAQIGQVNTVTFGPWFIRQLESGLFENAAPRLRQIIEDIEADRLSPDVKVGHHAYTLVLFPGRGRGEMRLLVKPMSKREVNGKGRHYEVRIATDTHTDHFRSMSAAAVEEALQAPGYNDSLMAYRTVYSAFDGQLQEAGVYTINDVSHVHLHGHGVSLFRVLETSDGLKLWNGVDTAPAAHLQLSGPDRNKNYNLAPLLPPPHQC